MCSQFSQSPAIPLMFETILSTGFSAWHRLLKSVLVIFVAISIAIVVGVPSAAAQQYDKDNLSGADFSGRDFSGANFVQTNLRDATLKGTNFTGALMFGVFLDGADLEGANFSFATLDSAHFDRANLKKAVLEGAFAFNATFKGADIEGADFTDVLMRDDQLRLLCKVASGTNPTTGRETRETLLCP